MMSSSHLMFPLDEEDLWESSMIWPESGISSGSSSSRTVDEDEAIPSLTSSMWASDAHISSNWGGVLNEDTVLFSDFHYSSRQLLNGGHEVDDGDGGGIIADSCSRPHDQQQQLQGDEEELNHLEDATEEHVLFLPAAPVTLQREAAVQQKTNVEGDEEAQFPRLVVKVEAEGFVSGCSAVSTPDVVNDIMDMLGDGDAQGLFCKTEVKQEDNSMELDGPAFKVEVDDDHYEEYVVEFVDGAALGLTEEAFSPNPPPVKIESAANTDNEAWEEEEDGGSDEDYKPEMEARVGRSRRSSRSSSVSSGGIKKRGRPAKPLRTHLSPRELAHLPPEEAQKFKNNEASRLSRYKKRQKDLLLNDQCEMYERDNRELRRILKSHKQLHKRFWALMVALKMPE